MKRLSIFIAVCMLTFFVGNTSHAQRDDHWHKQGHIGLSNSMFDTGLGLNLAVSIAYEFNPYIYLESQLSYNYVNVWSAFLNGSEFQKHDFNLLLGPRVYVLPQENNTRVYLNLLTGLNYNGIKKPDDLGLPMSMGWGLSFGGYVELQKQYTIGLAFETEGNLALKFGFYF